MCLQCSTSYIIQLTLCIGVHPCRFSRECKRAFKYEEMTIPEGCSLIIPSYLLHKDPEYWEDPEKFEPLRYIIMPFVTYIIDLQFEGS